MSNYQDDQSDPFSVNRDEPLTSLAREHDESAPPLYPEEDRDLPSSSWDEEGHYEDPPLTSSKTEEPQDQETPSQPPRTIAYHDTLMGLASLASGTLISALSILYGIKYVDRYNSPQFVLVIIGMLTGWGAIYTVNPKKRSNPEKRSDPEKTSHPKKTSRRDKRTQEPSAPKEKGVKRPAQKYKELSADTLMIMSSIAALVLVVAYLAIRTMSGQDHLQFDEQGKPRISTELHSSAACSNQTVLKNFRKHMEQKDPSAPVTAPRLLSYLFYSRSKLCLNESCDVEPSPLRFTYQHPSKPKALISQLCREGKKLKHPLNPNVCKLSAEQLEGSQVSFSIDYQECASAVCTSFLDYKEDAEKWCRQHKNHLCCAK